MPYSQAIPVDYDPFNLAPAGTVIDPNEKDPFLQKRNEILLQEQQFYQQQQGAQPQQGLMPAPIYGREGGGGGAEGR